MSFIFINTYYGQCSGAIRRENREIVVFQENEKDGFSLYILITLFILSAKAEKSHYANSPL